MDWSTINRHEVALKSVAGLIGGLLSWVPVELWFAVYPDGLLRAGTNAAPFYYLAEMFFPAFVGLLINATDVQDFTTGKAKRFLLVTFIACFVLGLPAAYYSQALFTHMTTNAQVFRSEGIAFRMVTRGVAFIVFGLVAGAGVGLATRSVTNVIKGAIGGAIGGFFGGLLFDPIFALTSIGPLSRVITSGEEGLLIGLMIGLVQDLTKTAWLTVEAGRLRNRQFRLEKPVTALGRAEECDIGLFGDAAVEARHAVIERKGDEFILNDLGHPMTVNGRPAHQATLRGGERIGIGNYELRFNLREATAPRPESAASIPAALPIYPRFIDASGRELALRIDAYTRMGRSHDNDIVIADSSVSRHHAAVEPNDGRLRLRDLESQNGVYVGGNRVSEHWLGDGDVVRLGDVQLTFRL
ncbi:MAG: FHA domain-containing protein [Candidatus Binataceae bacterium]